MVANLIVEQFDLWNVYKFVTYQAAFIELLGFAKCRRKMELLGMHVALS